MPKKSRVAATIKKEFLSNSDMRAFFKTKAECQGGKCLNRMSINRGRFSLEQNPTTFSFPPSPEVVNNFELIENDWKSKQFIRYEPEYITISPPISPPTSPLDLSFRRQSPNGIFAESEDITECNILKMMKQEVPTPPPTPTDWDDNFANFQVPSIQSPITLTDSLENKQAINVDQVDPRIYNYPVADASSFNSTSTKSDSLTLHYEVSNETSVEYGTSSEQNLHSEFAASTFTRKRESNFSKEYIVPSSSTVVSSSSTYRESAQKYDLPPSCSVQIDENLEHAAAPYQNNHMPEFEFKWDEDANTDRLVAVTYTNSYKNPSPTEKDDLPQFNGENESPDEHPVYINHGLTFILEETGEPISVQEIVTEEGETLLVRV